jgi:hypothetical protein
MNRNGGMQSYSMGFDGSAERGLLDQKSGALSQISLHLSLKSGSNRYAVQNARVLPFLCGVVATTGSWLKCFRHSSGLQANEEKFEYAELLEYTHPTNPSGREFSA